MKMKKKNIDISKLQNQSEINQIKQSTLGQFLDHLGENLIAKTEQKNSKKEKIFDMNFETFHNKFSKHFSQLFEKENEQLMCTQYLYSILLKHKYLSKDVDIELQNKAIQHMKEFVNSIDTTPKNKKSNKPLLFIKNEIEITKIKDGVSVLFIKENNNYEINFKKKLIHKESNTISNKEFVEYLNLIEKKMKKIK